MIKVIYIAGPFRGLNSWVMEQNIREAEGYALRIWQLGGTAVICPHTNTRYFQGAAPDDTWLRGDLEILRRCDAVFMLPKWKDSEGAQMEHAEAVRCSIPVFDCMYDLKEWLGGSIAP